MNHQEGEFALGSNLPGASNRLSARIKTFFDKALVVRHDRPKAVPGHHMYCRVSFHVSSYFKNARNLQLWYGLD